MSGPLRIAVASGKGGTGKTTIATSLAVALAEAGLSAVYVDCDVEEPNGHIFLAPALEGQRRVTTPVPEVDEGRCDSCGACASACRFSAIVSLPGKVVTFPHLCHGCGGCLRACPRGAIREVPRPTGVVEWGTSGPLRFLAGRLDVGEAMAPPVIRAVLAAAPGDATLVVDAPPGTSCPVIEAVRTADAVVLVTEPTPFGLNDLALAVGMVRELGLPFGVVVNRAGSGDRGVHDYCAAEGIEILLEIPDDLEIARAYSRGELAVRAVPSLGPLLLDLHRRLGELGRRLGESGRRAVGPAPAAFPGEESSERELPSASLQIGRREGVGELVVVSGKGGTGKTSLTASFLALAGEAVAADCDVDAADLHLVLDPTVRRRWPFRGGTTAVLDAGLCTGCGLCLDLCRFGAIRPARDGTWVEVDPLACEGCGVCVDVCPAGALSLVPTVNGQLLLSDTRHGPLVHARLGIAEENSGKLVSLVRKEAKALAAARRSERLLCDGSPGIGCPVIASITGARFVLVVTEPTLSGQHDLRRVADLCRRLGVPAGVCVNKADLNPEVAAAIEAEAEARGLAPLGRVRYDPAVTRAQVRRLSVVEAGDGMAAEDIRALWGRVLEALPARRPAAPGGERRATG